MPVRPRFSRLNYVLVLTALAIAVGVICAVVRPLSGLTSAEPRAVVNSGRAEKQHLPLEVTPDVVVFEPLQSGEPERKTLVVRNAKAIPLVVERIQVSCLCVRVAPLRVELGPGEERTLTLTVDYSSELRSDDKTSVWITGFLSDEAIAFEARADINAAR